MSDGIRKEQPSVRSFRVTDDVMSRFKSLQEELGVTQDGALKALISAYELDQAKNVMPDRETEIANFQTKATELVNAFMYSLQLNQDAEARIRAEVAVQMESKDKTIVEYQERVAKLKEANEQLLEDRRRRIDLEVQFASVQTQIDAKQQEMDQLQAQCAKQLEDKAAINEMLVEKLAAAEKKAEQYDSLRVERDALAGQVQEAAAAAKQVAMEHQMEMERAAFAAAKSLDEAVTAARAEGQAKAGALAEALQETKIQAAKDLQAAEKAAHEAERAATAELRKAEQEIYHLKQELAELKSQIRNQNG